MRQRYFKAVPILITLGVVLLVCGLKLLPLWYPEFDALERLEQMTYDWRVRLVLTNEPVPPEVGAVLLDEPSLEEFNKPENGGLVFPLPRFVYADVLAELKAQGAKAVAFDIFFKDRLYEWDKHRTPTPGNPDGLPSDEYFAYQLGKAENAILVAHPEYLLDGKLLLGLPQEMFGTNALGLAITSIGDAEIDSDSIHRRCAPYYDDPVLNQRFWHMGIVLAAVELGLDLEHATVTGSKVVLKGAGGVKRRIPLDADGLFYIPWTVPEQRLPSAQKENVFTIYQQHQGRKNGGMASNQFTNKLVVIGAAGIGNNVGDRGATPLEKTTVMCSLIWNVASAMIRGDFVRRAPLGAEIGLVILMAVVSGFLSWRLRGLWAPAGVFFAGGLYFFTALYAYAKYHYWVPLVLPLGGAVVMTYSCLVIYRLLVEMVERRRVHYIRAAFGERFPREVVDMLAKEEKASRVVQYLGLPPTVVRLLVREDVSAGRRGDMRRRVSIFFADIRNFTEYIDTTQAQAEREVQEQGMSAEEAERYMDGSARDVLATVNLYLSTIAEIVSAQQGTLDKYVGDAVMAFWGAPIPDDRHAVAAVTAAIAAQRAIKSLNQARIRENRNREAAREKDPSSPVPRPLPILSVGIAINSGEAIVGFMGSASLVSNYTVFGKEVNIASRLESLAEADRIVISEATYQELERLEPALAATCVPLEPVTLRGIRKPVRIFELPLPVTQWTTSARDKKVKV